MNQNIEINQGEIYVKFTNQESGNISFESLGLSAEQITSESGFLRLVFDFEGLGDLDLYMMPTVTLEYAENCAETHWQCEFNGETILDKFDHHGNSTVLLLNKNKMSELVHHHENKLVIHAEFPEVVHLSASGSYVHFFK